MRTYLFPGFVDQREAPEKLVVAGITLTHVVQEAAVDLVDDLEVPRQELAEERQRPLLERLGQQRVVRVAAGSLRDCPGLIPVHRVLVHEEPHQLGDGDGRMRVVQLRGPVRVETLPGFLPAIRCRRIMSCSEQETKKYCCASRSRFPASGSSFG